MYLTFYSVPCGNYYILNERVKKIGLEQTTTSQTSQWWAKSPVCKSVFLTIWHCILSAALAILPTGRTCNFTNQNNSKAKRRDVNSLPVVLSGFSAIRG